MSPSKFLLKSLFKLTRLRKRVSGFTLLELLVALVLTFLIITPVMSLVISLMGTDRQEQAKNSSQQEIQAALEYIAQDMQQAVYIYDASALSSTGSSDKTTSGIQDQIPPTAGADGCRDATKCVPVIAFWKRKYLDRNDPWESGRQVEDIPDSSQGSDRYVYSLVVYYLIKGTNAGETWSPVARIGRFEIHDGIIDPTSTSTPPSYLYQPDRGFKPFDLTAAQGSIQQSLNMWKKDSGDYSQPVQILVDFIDDTPLTALPSSVKTQFTPPTNNDTNTYGYLTSTTAGQPLGQTGCDQRTGAASPPTAITAALPGSSRVPPDPVPADLDTGSFYACINPVNAQGQSVAQVYLRGNALPRLNKDPKTEGTQLSYRPTASVRVAVRGLLGE